jgi:transposase
MEQVSIGVDPQKLSATIEVVDDDEGLLGSGWFNTVRAGYAAMRTYARRGPIGSGRSRAPTGRAAIGSAALEAGENVVDGPAKLAAR